MRPGQPAAIVAAFQALVSARMRRGFSGPPREHAARHVRPDKVGREQTPVGAGPDRLRGVAAGVAHAPHHPHLSSVRLQRRRRPPPRETAAVISNRRLAIDLGRCPAPGARRRENGIAAFCPLERGERCSRVCVPPSLARGCHLARPAEALGSATSAREGDSLGTLSREFRGRASAFGEASRRRN